jgi:GNAT superfamily N-acetyltransferase
MKKNKFRFAAEEDTPLILDFIRALAKYEKREESVVITEEVLKYWLFEEKKAEVIFVLKDQKEVGFALFFYVFSTFSGKAGLYIEDLFVDTNYRKQGFGKALIKQVARIALERGCQKLDWTCLKWNQPSIDFYLSLGAVPINEWTKYQLSDEALARLVVE